MPANVDDPCVLYYIGLPGSDPYRGGYIRISKNQSRRARDHRWSGKFAPGATFSVLLEGRGANVLSWKSNIDHSLRSA